MGKNINLKCTEDFHSRQDGVDFFLLFSKYKPCKIIQETTAEPKK